MAACRNSFLRSRADWINEIMMILRAWLYNHCNFFIRVILDQIAIVFCADPMVFPALATPTPPRLFAASLVWPGTPFFYSYITFMKCIYELSALPDDRLIRTRHPVGLARNETFH
jgi:hypothetical protein